MIFSLPQHNSKEYVAVESDLSQKLATASFNGPHTFTSSLAPPHTTPRKQLTFDVQMCNSLALMSWYSLGFTTLMRTTELDPAPNEYVKENDTGKSV